MSDAVLYPPTNLHDFLFLFDHLHQPSSLTIPEFQRTALENPGPQESPNYFTLSIKFVLLTVAHSAKITCFVNYPITLQPPPKKYIYQETIRIIKYAYELTQEVIQGTTKQPPQKGIKMMTRNQ